VKRVLLFFLALAALALAADARADTTLHVGSKRFTESYILAEIVTALARVEGDHAAHAQGLGGTAIVYRALEEGSVDIYPDYTGTIAEAVLHTPGAGLGALRAALAPRGIGVTEPLGFENTYALAASAKAGIRAISEIAARPELRIGLSHEFLGRSDGWPGLAARYAIPPERAMGMDHGLAYEALEKGAIDVLDVYSTDAKLKRYGLTSLLDDRAFFPKYEAVFLYRLDLPKRFPRTWARLLATKLDARTMIDLNAQAELDHRTFAEVAAAFVGAPAPERESTSFLGGLFAAFVRYGPRHLLLVAISLALAIVVGVPLGIAANRRPRLGAVVLSATGVVQTIPALALLCFFIPVFGIGRPPALAALFLYSLLPIVRNTFAGLEEIPPALREAAAGIGLTSRERLLLVELPMASRTVLAGIKTSAVINVGTATIAAFIGAGGFGEPISTGLNLNDNTMVLEGAIPAAILALVVQGLFAVLDRAIVPRGLRVAPAASDD
jgi:osmoprotectant transport system substrate-binding protein/osmoprotectant transport system permease protein